MKTVNIERKVTDIMGAESSKNNPSLIENINARTFFNEFESAYSTLKDNDKKKSNIITTLNATFESLKLIPATEDHIGLILTGSKTGYTFFNTFYNLIRFPICLTKLSFRKSGITYKNSNNIALVVHNMPQLQQLDISENNIGDSIKVVIRACTGHASLISFQFEETQITKEIYKDLLNLIAYTSKLETLRLAPIDLDQGAVHHLQKTIAANRTITNLSICKQLDTNACQYTERNQFIYEFADLIARSPFQRNCRSKISPFKSVRGREMLAGRAKQKELAKGTDLFKKMDDFDKHAKESGKSAQVYKFSNLLRSGNAETIGQRPSMEDVTLIKSECPSPSSSLFAIFDGHGGRDAAEYAAQQLPDLLRKNISLGIPLEVAYQKTFNSLHEDMRSWCCRWICFRQDYNHQQITGLFWRGHCGNQPRCLLQGSSRYDS